MISCAAIQKLERYGYLGLKRHSTEDFIATSLKDPKRANVYALTLLETWQEAVQAVRGGAVPNAVNSEASAARRDDALLTDVALAAAPARFTDALVYAMSFAVALTTQHVLDVFAAPQRQPNRRDSKADSGATAPPSSFIFSDDHAQALALLTSLKEMGQAVGSGRALRGNAASDEFTKAVAHLMTNVLDLVLVLLATYPAKADDGKADSTAAQQSQALLAQALVLTASTAQTLRRVQATFPVPELYHTRPCAALLKQVSNKQKQQQKAQHGKTAEQSAVERCHGGTEIEEQATTQPLFYLLHHYVEVCVHAAAATASSTVTAASLFSIFSLFQRLAMLHGALGTLQTLSSAFPDRLRLASEDVQHWLSQLLSSTACNRATRYVVYFREDELRLLQHNIRHASEYALYTFATTPPVDPGLVESLLEAKPTEETEGSSTPKHREGPSSPLDAVVNARAALVLAQWCVSAPFFFESFCQGETWATFAQEQRRLMLLQQSRARRGLEKSTSSSSKAKRLRASSLEGAGSTPSSASTRSSSVSSKASDTASVSSHASHHTDAASLLSLQTASALGHGSVNGSVTSLASRASLLSTFSKHSAASYLSFLSVMRPSTAGDTVAGGAQRTYGKDVLEGDAAATTNERQMHESEDGNTNLPLILLEQLTLGLHRFMETYPVTLLDTYGLRSISWDAIARMFAFVEASLMHLSVTGEGRRGLVLSSRHSGQTIDGAAGASATLGGLPQPLFNLAQDIRYNKGTGYECLGLLFAKVVAPLLDVAHAPPHVPENEVEEEDKKQASGAASKSKAIEEQEAATHHRRHHDRDDEAEHGIDSDADVNSVDGDRTEEGFFANAAAASATVGRAGLSTADDAKTRAKIEEALSTCLTAYETVAPQVVDMNLATILRLAARTAAASAEGKRDKGKPPPQTPQHTPVQTATSAPPPSWSTVLVSFLQDITRRLGRSNELPHLVDALLGRDEATRRHKEKQQQQQGTQDEHEEELSNLHALRSVFQLPPVRRALVHAAGMSLDPESLLLHLNSIATDLEANVPSAADTPEERYRTKQQENDVSSEEEVQQMPGTTPPSSESRWQCEAWVQRTMLTLELTEAALDGVTPTSVSASAVLEQTTQLELLLTASFVACVQQQQHGKVQLQDAAHRLDLQQLVMQHAYTIRQCRAVTVLCLQDLGTQQVQEYLSMLDETLWQLSSDVGHLIGPLTMKELEPLFQQGNADSASSVTDASALQLLLPSLVLQRLALARAVTAALNTAAGPADQLQELVAFIWSRLANTRTASDATSTHATTAECDNKTEEAGQAYVSLLLANQMTAEEWGSLVALGKERHARTAMVALLTLSTTVGLSATSATVTSTTPAWMSCCLHCIPGTLLRALVDVYVGLSIEDVGEALLQGDNEIAPQQQQPRQWTALVTALVDAYEQLGHNPYWPSMLTHTVRAIAHVARIGRKAQRKSGVAGEVTATLRVFSGLLMRLVLCVLRSEARAGEVLRKALLALIRESHASAATAAGSPTPPVLSRSGLSVAYVETIKVPATVLSDLGAPAALTAAAAANAGEAMAGWTQELAAFKHLSYEDELRDLCGLLFSPGFVKSVFAVADFGHANGEKKRNESSASMSVLAFLYQTSMAAAQTAWRAKATDGSVQAFLQTPATQFLQNVSETFHTRVCASVQDISTTTPILTQFLDEFDRSAGAAETVEQYLFLHIATPTGATAAPPTTATTAGPVSVLDGIERVWESTFRHVALAVLRGSATAADTDAVVPENCLVFRAIFAQLLRSALHKQQQMSKSSTAGSSAANGDVRSTGKRPRRGNAKDATAEPNAQQTSRKGRGESGAAPAAAAAAAAAVARAVPRQPLDNELGGTNAVAVYVNQVLRRVLTGPLAVKDNDAVSKAEEGEAQKIHDETAASFQKDARQLRTGLDAFFGVSDSGVKEEMENDGDGAGDNDTTTSVTATCVPRWTRFVLAGAEEGVCAFWLLWKLLSVSVTLRWKGEQATAPEVYHRAHARVRTFLAVHPGQPTSVSSTVSTCLPDDVTLRALSILLSVVPTEAAPPLFFSHLQDLLARVVPTPNEIAATVLPVSTSASSPSSIAAAIELLLHLFQVRPRISAPQVLPHAQRLLVWLTSPAARAPSLRALAIRLIAAVTAHPSVALGGGGAAASTGKMAGNPSAVVINGVASELLDNVWLLLFSLLDRHGGGSGHTVGVTGARSAPSLTPSPRVELEESEVIQVLLLLTKTWLRGRQQLLWSRPALLPSLMTALFACVMRGMEEGRYTPRVLNVLAGGLAAMAAHVDEATAVEGDDDVTSESEGEENGEGSDDDDEAGITAAAVGLERKKPSERAKKTTINALANKKRKTERASQPRSVPAVSAALKRMALAATTAALFEVSQHYVHVFTSFSSDMDFLFTDFLRVLSQHFLPTITRPPIAYHANVRIGGTTQSDMTFADLAYLCVGHAESKSLLKQAALRMEEEAGDSGGGLTSGPRSIFRVA